MSGCSRQQRWRQRERQGLVVLQVEVDEARLVTWLIAAGLLDHADQDDRHAMAKALWKAAELSMEEFEMEL